MIATGGALGGVFVALLAPSLFTTYAEYPLGLGALLSAGRARAGIAARAWTRYPGKPYWVIAPLAGLSMGLLAAVVTWTSDATRTFWRASATSTAFCAFRNRRDVNGPKRLLTHGRVTHGFQYLDPEKRDWPTTYFGPASGIGLAMRFHPRRERADARRSRARASA